MEIRLFQFLVVKDSMFDIHATILVTIMHVNRDTFRKTRLSLWPNV